MSGNQTILELDPAQEWDDGDGYIDRNEAAIVVSDDDKRLIAAAPELLAALERVVPVARSMAASLHRGQMLAGERALLALAEECEAAIAMAKGDTP